MPFKSCACYVWAIAGYENDGQAKKVEATFNTVGSRLAAMWKGEAVSLDERILNVRSICRRELGIAEVSRDCIIYGGWMHGGQGTPDHMWLEYEGYIYDTMPEQALYRRGPSAVYKYSPACDQNAFNEFSVGECRSKLTKFQLENLTTAADKWKKVTGDIYSVFG